MKAYQTKEIRNICLVGNAGAGKTTLAEAMLFAGDEIQRRGNVEQGTTVSDYRDIEKSRKSSVYASVMYTEFNNRKINILDCPGADDFSGAAMQMIQIADTAMLVLNTQNGVETGAEAAFRYAEKYNKPLMLIANQLDSENANFDFTMEEAAKYLGDKVSVVQYPHNPGPGFNSVVDVLLMKLVTWQAGGGKPALEPIPDDEIEKATEYQKKLVEAAAENDESLMEIYFDKGTLTEDEIRAGLAKGMLKRIVFPVFCASAACDMGVRRILEFACNVLPSPDKMPPALTQNAQEIKCDENLPCSLFVFKNTSEPHIGNVLYFKVMSGKVKEGDDLTNEKLNKERLAQIFVNNGKNRIKAEELVAGDIGSTLKLKETTINQTLFAGNEIKFVTPEIPGPKYRTAVKCEVEADDAKLGEALNALRSEDPSLMVEYSKELRQTILSGRGELHLNIVKWYLDNVFKVKTEYQIPKIPYRETITRAAQADYRHKKQSGGSGQFAEVHLVIRPHENGVYASNGQNAIKTDKGVVNVNVKGKEEISLSWGGKLVFYNCIVGGVIDGRFMPAILKGVMEKMERGPLTGSYARDIDVFVYDGKMHPVDSNEISFKIAGMTAFKEAFKNAQPKILEPVYNLEVLIPAERVGDAMSDLQGRRAVITGMLHEGFYEKLVGTVPLAEMDKYAISLSSLSNGRGIYDMNFSDYVQVGPDIQDKLLKAYADEDSEQ